MSKLTDLFRITAATPGAADDDPLLDDGITQDDHRERLEVDKALVVDGSAKGRKLQKEAERRVVIAAEDSLTKMHIVKMGRCPDCGDHLRKHFFASICENCGWNTYDVPRSGPVRVHLRDESRPIEGDRCYWVKQNTLLVVRKDVVIARISYRSVSWIEYMWSDDEVSQRHREVYGQLDIQCGWCGTPADIEKDGFHLTHVAFGNTQERYCFCSDNCYEAFRKMYPARVDRNCYERSCSDCNLCVKRYDDEAEGMRVLAKDLLRTRRRNEQQNLEP